MPVIRLIRDETEAKPRNWDAGKVVRANEVYALGVKKDAVAGGVSSPAGIKPVVCSSEAGGSSGSQLQLPGTVTPPEALKLSVPPGFYLDQRGEPMGKCVVVLLLPHSPSVNHAYAMGKNKTTGKPIRYRTPAYKEWIAKCHQLITGGGIRKAVGVEFPIPVERGVKLTILASFPTGKHDLDNINKAVFDVLNGAILEDDEQVMELKSFKSFSLNPSVRVAVEIPEEYKDWKQK